MGGVWTSGMPLAIEHWPPHLRGRVSGMLQSGYSTGFMLSAFVYSFIYPIANTRPDFGWRVMLWLGLLPALLVLFIGARVKESPVWLERKQRLKASNTTEGIAIARLFRRDLIGTTIHASLVMAAFLCFYYSITFWYATFVGRDLHQPTLPFLVALNLGTMIGNLVWGHVSETRAGRRGATTIAALGGIACVPLYLLVASAPLLVAGAFLMGMFGAGCFGVVPSYLNERFPTAARAAGAGLAYHVGAATSSLMPFLVGLFQDRGIRLAIAMGGCIAITGAALAIFVWLGPETRGTALVES
jgi:MFS transporter, SHS family, lactate transporter